MTRTAVHKAWQRSGRETVWIALDGVRDASSVDLVRDWLAKHRGRHWNWSVQQPLVTDDGIAFLLVTGGMDADVLADALDELEDSLPDELTGTLLGPADHQQLHWDRTIQYGLTVGMAVNFDAARLGGFPMSARLPHWPVADDVTTRLLERASSFMGDGAGSHHLWHSGLRVAVRPQEAPLRLASLVRARVGAMSWSVSDAHQIRVVMLDAAGWVFLQVLDRTSSHGRGMFDDAVVLLEGLGEEVAFAFLAPTRIPAVTWTAAARPKGPYPPLVGMGRLEENMRGQVGRDDHYSDLIQHMLIDVYPVMLVNDHHLARMDLEGWSTRTSADGSRTLVMAAGASTWLDVTRRVATGDVQVDEEVLGEEMEAFRARAGDLIATSRELRQRGRLRKQGNRQL